METSHLTAGACNSERLVKDDCDRTELLRCVAASVGAAAILAFCMLDTHLHAIIEGAAARVREAGASALLRYTRTFNRRHGRSGSLLRCPVEAMPAFSAREIARQIDYVHQNPVKMDTPIVSSAILFEWSSARAFAGLSCAPVPNVARALELMGPDRSWVARKCPPLVGLEPASFPALGVSLVLAAAAQAFGVAALELVGVGRAPEVLAARAVYVALGCLEGFRDGQLAAPLGRTARRMSQLAAAPIDPEAVRIARTLLHVPEFRARLRIQPIPAASPIGAAALPIPRFSGRSGREH